MHERRISVGEVEEVLNDHYYEGPAWEPGGTEFRGEVCGRRLKVWALPIAPHEWELLSVAEPDEP